MWCMFYTRILYFYTYISFPPYTFTYYTLKNRNPVDFKTFPLSQKYVQTKPKSKKIVIAIYLLILIPFKCLKN